jgi:hypothetical protein
VREGFRYLNVSSHYQKSKIMKFISRLMRGVLVELAVTNRDNHVEIIDALKQREATSWELVNMPKPRECGGSLLDRDVLNGEGWRAGGGERKRSGDPTSCLEGALAPVRVLGTVGVRAGTQTLACRSRFNGSRTCVCK